MKQYEGRGIELTCRTCGATAVTDRIPPSKMIASVLGCGHKNYLARGVKIATPPSISSRLATGSDRPGSRSPPSPSR